MKLNQSQNEAVSHFQGPCLVLAGPGSGKTAVIVSRTQKLVQEHHIRPEEILVITFSKYAAREMKERYRRETDVSCHQVTFGTFHGIYYGILKWAYGIGPANLMSDQEKFQLLRACTERCEEDLPQEQEFLQELSGELGIVKNSRIRLEEYKASCCSEESFRDIFRLYEKKRKELRKLDFDDVLTACCRLFETRADILAKWQKHYSYILVDEFQDINQVQYDVIKLLAAPRNNLFVVGDDDQSIYGFRGARSELLFQFKKDYPAARQLLLDVNYRSTRSIVRMAGRVIEHNRQRFEKQIRSEKGQGRPVHVQELEDVQEEADYIAREIRKRTEKGEGAEKIAVLFRVYGSFEIVAEALSGMGIAFWMREPIFNIYQHFIGENLAAYFRLALGGRSRRDFLSIMNRPNRYISRESLEGDVISFESLRNFYCDKAWMQDRIDQLDVDLRMLKSMTPYGAIQYLRKSMNYDEFLKEYAARRGQNEEKLFDILDELGERAKGLKTLEEWFEQAERCTELLNAEKRRMDREGQEGVQLMTLHSSKGLEFDTVFIAGVNEGMLPYRRMQTKEETEEERRLFYVGMTRAKEELIITYPLTKNGKDLTPSRFVSELLSESSPKDS